jgi:hypothetical protein
VSVCTICGAPFLLGNTALHARCGEKERLDKIRSERLDVLLTIFAEDIDHFLSLQEKARKKEEKG